MEENKKIHIKTLIEHLYNTQYDISEKDFLQLKENYDLLMTIVWINEKYGMILDNYYEFVLEVDKVWKELLEAKEKQIVSIGKKSIVTFNRRLSNLLCSVRMYIDQTQCELSRLNLNECTKDDFHSYTSERYDNSISYQVMELLRNHMQHQGLIVDRITFMKPFCDNQEYIFLVIDIAYKRLCNIERYEKKIFLDNILKDMNVNTFNLLWFVDEYVKGLEIVHKKLMEKLLKNISCAQNEIELILRRYYEKIPSEIGVFSDENDFLIQYNYVLQASDIPKMIDCYEGKKYFKSSENITGNFQSNRIRYNM